MELEIYDALQSAGVTAEKAKAAVESINREIDRRYNLHAAQLATRGDIEQTRADIEKAKGELKTELAKVESNLIKWLVSTALVIIATLAAILTRLPPA